MILSKRGEVSLLRFVARAQGHAGLSIGCQFPADIGSRSRSAPSCFRSQLWELARRRVSVWSQPRWNGLERPRLLEVAGCCLARGRPVVASARLPPFLARPWVVVIALWLSPAAGSRRDTSRGKRYAPAPHAPWSFEGSPPGDDPPECGA